MLIAGIFIGECVGGNIAAWSSFALSAVWLLLAIVFSFRKPIINVKSGAPLLGSICTLCSVFFFGFFLVNANRERMCSRLSVLQQCSSVAADHRTKEAMIVFEAVIVTPPSQRGKVLRFDAVVTSQKVKPFLVHASLLRDTVSNNHLALALGAGIRVRSALKLERRQAVPATFITPYNWQLSAPRYSRLTHLQRARLRLMLFREQLLERWHLTHADAESEAVVAAMVLGDKGRLSRELRDEYSISGAAHVLALSGMHLSIIYFLLSFVFIRRRWRMAGQLFVLPVIWLYALMVGLPPSVVRAATMLMVYSLVILLNRRPLTFNTISLAALVMLIANPFNLWDIGFQLSFMAVLGIILFYRPFYRFLSALFSWPVNERFLRKFFVKDKQLERPERGLWNTLRRWVLGMVAVSMSTQLLSAPLVAFYFGRFSTYFLLTNLLVVPLVAPILYAALLFFLLWFLPSLQLVVGKIVAWLAWLLNASISWVSSLPFASVEGISLSVWQVVLIYLLIALLSYFVSLLSKRLRKWVLYSS